LIVFGAYALVRGVFGLVAAIATPIPLGRGWLIVSSLAGIAVGVPQDPSGGTSMSNMVQDVEDEIKQLEAEAEVGESAATPLILGAEVWVWTSAAVVVILALSLLAYRLGS
jgi:hypothetical protein